MKIVLVDDNERLVQIYQSILNKKGYQTEIVLDTSNVVERIRSIKPDMILLDIMMEPLSGWDVLDLIKKEQDLSEILVIVLTGKVMSVEEALRYGMYIDGYVMKPLERSMLISVIEEVWEIFNESLLRYGRAIESGMSVDEASLCSKMFRKRKMLAYLKDLLVKQEKILSFRPEEQAEMLGSITELKNMITSEYQKLSQSELACP